MSETSNENDYDEESYFADLRTAGEEPDTAPPPRPSDERGYIIRQSILEDGTIPRYIIPVGSASGTWGMMKCLGRFEPEGWLSLWKGTRRDSVTRAAR